MSLRACAATRSAPSIHGNPISFVEMVATTITCVQQETHDSGDYVFHPDVLKQVTTSLPQDLNVDSELNFELNDSQFCLRPLRRQDFRNGGLHRQMLTRVVHTVWLVFILFTNNQVA